MSVSLGTAVGYLSLDYSDFSRNLTSAVNEATSMSGKLSDTLGKGLTTIGGKIETCGKTLTTGLTVPIAGAAAASVKFGADFDAQMSSVKAVSGATTEEFNRMREAAISWGEKTVYTATEAGEALYYMGLAGWDCEESVNGLGPVLNLAAAGNLELGRTSDIVTDAMTAMGYQAGELTNGIENTEHFTNALAATMSNSNTDVDQLGEAFKYVSPLAGQLGYSIDDLSIALGLMANVGVKGSQAGTGLRQALKNLIDPTDDCAAVMDKYNISLYDSQGKAKDLRTFMSELRNTFGDVGVSADEVSKYIQDMGFDLETEEGQAAAADAIMQKYGKNLPINQQEKLNAIVELFGTRALPGILGIIGASEEDFNSLAAAVDGSDAAFVEHEGQLYTMKEALEQWGDAVYNDDSFTILGAAAGQAQTQMDNLKGDWTKLTSALGTSQIIISDIVNGVLRDFVQKLTELVQWFNNLDTEQQKHILKCAAIIAAIGPVLLVFGKLITGLGNLFKSFHEISKAIKLVKTGFSMLTTAIGGISAPVVAIIAVIALLVAAFVNLWKNNEEFREKVTAIWDGVKQKFEEFGNGIVERLNALGFDFENITEVISAVWNGFCELLAPVFEGAFEIISAVLGTVLDVITGLLDIFIGLFTGNWEQCWNGVKEVFGGIWEGIKGVFSGVITAIKGIADTILGWFGTDWNTVWQGIKDFFVGIWEGIKTFFTNTVNNIKSVATTVFNAIKTFFSTIWNGIKTIFTTVVGAIATFLSNTWNAIKTTITNVFNAIKSFISTVWNGIKTIISTVVNVIKTTITTVFNAIKTTITNILNAIKTVVTNVWNAIKTLISTVVNAIKTTITTVWNAIKTTITNVVNAIKTTVTNVFNAIKTTISTIVNAVKTTVSTVFEAMKTAVTNTVNNLKTAVSTTFTNLKTAISNTVENAKTAISNTFNNMKTSVCNTATNLKSSVSTTFTNLKTAISDAMDTAKSNAVTAMTNAKNSVVNVWNNIKSTFTNIGKNVIQGIIDGIGNMVSSLYESIKSALSGLVDKAKNALGISSPSKVMKEQVGEFIPSGISEGVKGVMPTATKDIQDSITSGINGLDVATPNMEIMTTGMVNAAKQAGTQFIATINTAMSQLPTVVQKYLMSALNNVQAWKAKMIEQAKQCVSQFVNSIITGLTPLPNKIQTILTSVMNVMSKFVSDMNSKGKLAAEGFSNSLTNGLSDLPGKMQTVGSNIVQGIWRGISNDWPWLERQVRNKANELLEAAKDELDIGSPSRRFADEVGQWLPKGIAVGFSDAMPATIKSMSSDINKGLYNLSVNDLQVDVTGKFSDSLTTLYEKVAIWFEDIEERVLSSVDNMMESLMNLIILGKDIDNQDYIRYNIIRGRGESDNTKDIPTSGNSGKDITERTYVFYSDRPIDEIEAARQLKKTERDIVEGFL